MSKPRWRWATRDRRTLWLRSEARILWTRKPMRVIEEFHGRYTDRYVHNDACNPGPLRLGSCAYFRKRFGRDLRPGEIRRLK